MKKGSDYDFSRPSEVDNIDVQLEHLYVCIKNVLLYTI